LACVQKTQRKGATGKGSGGKAKKTQLKFTINCSTPVEDEIMDAGAFEDFLRAKVKVNGKTGNLGNEISLSRDKNEIQITSDISFSKR